MRERIIKFEKSKSTGKKYTAYIQNLATRKIRKLDFGALVYQQYRDKTPLHLYSAKDHYDKRRMQNYFNRHSGTRKRKDAIEREIRKSHGYYTPKILSHKYLW